MTVTVNGDAIDETDETLVLNLSNAINSTIADGQGVGTIIDDDTSAVSIGNASVTEGNSGSVAAAFAVTLSMPNSRPVTVDYADRRRHRHRGRGLHGRLGHRHLRAGRDGQDASPSPCSAT